MVDSAQRTGRDPDDGENNPDNRAELRTLFGSAAHGPKRWHALMLVIIGLLFSLGLLLAGYRTGAFQRWLHRELKPVKTSVMVPVRAHHVEELAAAFALHHS